jgi:hypothetical protein
MRSKCSQDEGNEIAPKALGAMALSVQSAGHFQGPVLRNIANLESCKRNKCDSNCCKDSRNNGANLLKLMRP